MPNWKKVILSGSNAVLAEITASGNLSGSGTATASYGLFTGSFGGDGTNLDLSSNTSISTSPFPFSGDAQISGSLIVSQSYTAGDTDSTALRLIGSGSVSESGIFEVEGSAGPLFSVADGLDGVLMEVNNISGLPLFQVSSSNEVFVNRGNLTSGVTTATASFAYFTGSFAGDGSGLTNLPAGTTPTLDAVTSAGNVTSNAITAGTISGSAFKLNNENALSFSGNVLYVGNESAWTTVELGRETTDEIHVNGLLKAEQLLRAEQSAEITGSLTVSGSLQLDYNGNGNMVIGSGSGEALTTGTDNIIFGNNAAQGLDTGTDNIIIGKLAAKDIDVDDGANLILIGKNVASNGTFTSEDNSVVIGTQAGQGAKLADSVFIGYQAGASAGYNGANQSVAIGSYALANYGGSYNVAIGYQTLQRGYPGATIDNNIAIGYQAMQGDSNYAGPRNNIAIGHKAMQNTTTNINVGGGENIAIGYEAARPSDGSRYVGTKNIVIGYQAGHNSYSGDATHNIIIGPSASLAFSGSSDTLVIASGSSHLISGSFATGDIIFYNTASAPNFSGSFQGDGSGLTNLPASDPFPFTGDAQITGSLDVSGSLSVTDTVSLLNFDKNSGTIGPTANDGWELGIGTTADSGAKVRLQHGTYHNTGLLIHGRSSIADYTPLLVRDGSSVSLLSVLSDGLVTAHKNFKVGGNAQITGSLSITGSGGLSVESSGSTVFEVIGSEGTLFSIDDDLDGTIFTANDKSGLPVLEASASGEVYIGKSPQSLYTTAVISSNNANVTQSIYGLDTSSYGGAFFEYTAHSGSNARAGNIMSVWNGSSLNFTETTTTDIGSTSDLVMKVHISESQAQLAAFSTNAGYNIKTIIKSI